MSSTRKPSAAVRVGRAAVAATLLAGGVVASSTARADTFDSHSGIVSEDPADYVPEVLDGQVRAIVVLGDTVVAGGTFTQVREPGGTILARKYIFAFDRATGAIDPDFVPDLNSHVYTLEASADDQSVFVGGRFKKVNGRFNKKGLTKLDLAGNIAAGWTGRTNGRVNDMVEIDGTLYIGGNFTKVKSTVVERFAAVDAVTGQPLPGVGFDFENPFSTWRTNGSLSVDKLDVTSDGGRLVAVGNFGTIDGQTRSRLAVFDVAEGAATLSDWSTTVFSYQCKASKWPQYIRDIDIAPDDSYFVVVTTGAYSHGNAACDTATKWDLAASGAGQQPEWVAYTGGDTFYGVTISDDVIYAGGHMRWMNNPFAADRRGPGAVDRRGMVAIDPLNGLPFSWRSDRNPRGLGTFELLIEDDGLWIGDDTDFMGDDYSPRLKLMPLFGQQVPRPTAPTLPTTFFRTTAGALETASFDGVTIGGPAQADVSTSWGNVRGVTHLGGALFYGRADGTFWQHGFDGSALDAAPVQVNLNGITNSMFPIQNITGMFFDHEQGRLYYTMAGVDRLSYRYFTPESTIIGAQEFTAVLSSPVPWSDVRGMSVIGDQLYYGRSDGSLHRIDLAGIQPVNGTDVTLSGPAVDGVAWNGPGFDFVSPGSEFRPPVPAAQYEFEGVGSSTTDSWQVFDVPVVAGDELEVRLEWDDPGANLRLFLRDPSNSAVASDTTTNGSPKTLLHTAATTGTWSVAVKIKTGATSFRVLVNPTG